VPPPKLNFPMRVCQAPPPLEYSFTCQKSVPLEVSTVVML
jgi:hypothetical protein